MALRVYRSKRRSQWKWLMGRYIREDDTHAEYWRKIQFGLIKTRRAFLAAESAQANARNAPWYVTSQIHISQIPGSPMNCKLNIFTRMANSLIKISPQGGPLSFSHLWRWRLQPSGCSCPNPWSYSQQLNVGTFPYPTCLEILLALPLKKKAESELLLWVSAISSCLRLLVVTHILYTAPRVILFK